LTQADTEPEGLVRTMADEIECVFV
jgi:hypothetical protein